MAKIQIELTPELEESIERIVRKVVLETLLEIETRAIDRNSIVINAPAGGKNWAHLVRAVGEGINHG